jgi:hypothetical protein
MKDTKSDVLFVNVSIGSRFECSHCELAQVVHHLFDKLLHFVNDRREYCAFQGEQFFFVH